MRYHINQMSELYMNDIKIVVSDLISKLRKNDGTISLDEKVKIIFALTLIALGVVLILFAILYGIVAYSMLFLS